MLQSTLALARSRNRARSRFDYEHLHDYESVLRALILRVTRNPAYFAALMRAVSCACATFCLRAGLLLVCACEKHHVGEMPEVQREHAELGPGEAPRSEAGGGETSTSAAFSTTATPAEFFRGSKPR